MKHATSGRLECEACERWIPMGNPVEYQEKGWPRCCGKTMLWRDNSLTAYHVASAHGRGGQSRGYYVPAAAFDSLEDAIERQGQIEDREER